MKKILISWIGMTDMRASKWVEGVGIGPIAQAVTNRLFNKVVLISNYSETENNTYINWLKTKTDVEIEHHHEQLTDPTNYEQIYFIDIKVVTDVLAKNGSDVKLTFHISPGTPAMQVVWVILAKTRFEAELIESSKEHGVKTPYIPFEISAEFIPKLLSTT
jgi:sigma54-dependent transcription regulator